MAERTPPEFVDHLAVTIYTPENLERGRLYLKSRGLAPEKLPYPWVHTGPELIPYEPYRGFYPPQIFADSLYVPILDMRDPTGATLAGFDVRYTGPDQHRLRYHKFKRDAQTQLFYNFHGSLRKPYVIVAEGAIDAQSFIQLGYHAIAPLTALADPRFALLLYALAERIFIAYDNDADGMKATAKLLKTVAGIPVIANAFTALTYKGKDPNEGLKQFGPDYLTALLRNQIGEP